MCVCATQFSIFPLPKIPKEDWGVPWFAITNGRLFGGEMINGAISIYRTHTPAELFRTGWKPGSTNTAKDVFPFFWVLLSVGSLHGVDRYR